MARNLQDSTEQHVTKRSFAFVGLPLVLIALLGLNLIWEIIRANVPESTRGAWPLRFVLLDLSTTAALFGVAAGLLFARMQWAIASRPSIGYAITDEDGGFSADSPKWVARMHNGGPGIAVVMEFSYVVKFTNQPRSVPASLPEINQAMEARGLTDGVDYFVREMGVGAVYQPVTADIDRPTICWFTVKALVELEEFDIIVRVRDSLGDEHRRRFSVYDRMPSVAINAKKRMIANRTAVAS